MDYLSEFFKVPILQALGVVIVIAVAERVGIPIISILKNLLKINGKNGDVKKEMEDLHKHSEIANFEMGELNRKFDKLLDFAEKENEQHIEMLIILRSLKK